MREPGLKWGKRFLPTIVTFLSCVIVFFIGLFLEKIDGPSV